ncbi:MAG: FAD-binding oxidoreductase [Gammaproteobacteria bacterium]|nr:FAD-binding oxidoreductase [Gammaproteobacteria bacterium]
MSMQVTIDDFRQLLGSGGVLAADDARARRGGIYHEDNIAAQAVLRPRTTDEVAEILRRCNAARQTIIVHGGLTNLTHGADTRPADIVLSLERMNVIEEIEPLGRTMTVQAGVPLQVIQEAAAAHDLMFAVDLGARGSCQIGGNVSTNAGGNRVIRYGMMRENVLGLEAVLADGTVVSSLNRMIKNNAGFDLKHLFIGTEGQLGIVTRLVLRLREASRSQSTGFVAIDSFARVPQFLKHMDRELGGMLSAFEVMWASFYDAVTTPPARGKPPLPGEYPYYVLVESLGADPETDAARFEAAMIAAIDAGLAADAVLAKSQGERAALWALRDDVEQMFRYGRPIIFDVSLAIAYMEQYVADVQAALSRHYPDHHMLTFGHLGDGNLHFAIAVGDTGESARRKVEESVYGPLMAIGGSVSAEHGIGLEKKPYLDWCRTPAEIDLMRTLKRTLDPNGILNPGKVFDL